MSLPESFNPETVTCAPPGRTTEPVQGLGGWDWAFTVTVTDSGTPEGWAGSGLNLMVPEEIEHVTLPVAFPPAWRADEVALTNEQEDREHQRPSKCSGESAACHGCPHGVTSTVHSAWTWPTPASGGCQRGVHKGATLCHARRTA